MISRLISLKTALALIFLIVLTTPSNAQFYEIVDYIKRAATARDHIKQLHEGTLVVRLRSKNKNITAMRETLERDNLSKSQRNRVEKQLKETIALSKKENKEIAESMARYYKFSEYRIVYDSDIRQLFDKKESGYFLNQNLEIDADISIDLSKPFYVMGFGLTDASNNHRREGLIISDSNNTHLESPFPYYTRVVWPPMSGFGFFIGKTNISPRYRVMVERISKSLDRFYANARIKDQKDEIKKQIKDLKKDDGN